MTLRVIGAGFGRTGTSSLQLALEQLGFGRCHHLRTALETPERWSHWARAHRGESAAWEEIFEGYGSTVDWPSTTFWRELMVHYPDAKFILTVRSAQSWYESMQSTLIPFWKRVRNEVTHPDLRTLFETAQKGFGDFMDDADRMMAAFDAHNEEVTRTIPKERLLVCQASDGWEPVCKFLGVATPSEPYPTANTRDELSKILSAAKDLDRWHEQLAQRSHA